MDFEEILFGMGQVVTRMARSVRYRKASPLQTRDTVEWSSYVITAGDDIIDSILSSDVDIYETIEALRAKYRKASYVAKRINPAQTASIFDVYVYVLDEIDDYIVGLETKRRWV